MKLFFDIETIPDQSPDAKDDIAAKITPPGNMKKEETIAKWEEDVKPGLIDLEWRKTALNGTRGEIICLGFAVDDLPPIMTWRNLEDSEQAMLQEFFDKLVGALSDPNNQGFVRHPIWIGHYITGFDLRYLWQRCVINDVRPPLPVPYGAKPWSETIYDTKVEWSGLGSYSSSSSLDAICKALGMKGKGDMDGSKVWDAVAAGEITKVVEYCAEDVNDTRSIYKRMNFIG